MIISLDLCIYKCFLLYHCIGFSLHLAHIWITFTFPHRSMTSHLMQSCPGVCGIPLCTWSQWTGNAWETTYLSGSPPQNQLQKTRNERINTLAPSPLTMLLLRNVFHTIYHSTAFLWNRAMASDCGSSLNNVLYRLLSHGCITSPQICEHSQINDECLTLVCG